MKRDDVTFDSWGSRCAAWLYRPDGASDQAQVPCVVIAHGWTGVREQRLDAFAERFCAAGYGALVFDYRHFGASEGEPRQLLSIRRQHEDWFSALTYARALDWVDADRVAIWGTSFGGAHVLWIAARDARLAAVIANVPAVDLMRNLPRLGPTHALKLTVEGLKDLANVVRGRPPHMLPSVGPPGSTAVMNTPDAEPGFKALTPPDAPWRNEAAARIALAVGLYRPITGVGRIAAPVLYCIAEDDAITPADLAEEAAARTPGAEVRTYPGGHFDVYVDPTFESVVSDQVEFLQRHVPVAAPAETTARA